MSSISLDSKLLNAIGATARDRIRKRIIEGRIKHPKGKSKDSGKHLLRSHKLIGGIDYKIEGSKIVLGVTGPPQKYAKILHTGGIIKPRKAKFLAVPIATEARTMKPRDFTDTFIRNGVIYRKISEDKIIALYVLKKQVEIPAFDYFKLESDDIKIISQRVHEYLNEKFKGV